MTNLKLLIVYLALFATAFSLTREECVTVLTLKHDVSELQTKIAGKLCTSISYRTQVQNRMTAFCEQHDVAITPFEKCYKFITKSNVANFVPNIAHRVQNSRFAFHGVDFIRELISEQIDIPSTLPGVDPSQWPSTPHEGACDCHDNDRIDVSFSFGVMHADGVPYEKESVRGALCPRLGCVLSELIMKPAPLRYNIPIKLTDLAPSPHSHRHCRRRGLFRKKRCSTTVYPSITYSGSNTIDVYFTKLHSFNSIRNGEQIYVNLKASDQPLRTAGSGWLESFNAVKTKGSVVDHGTHFEDTRRQTSALYKVSGSPDPERIISGDIVCFGHPTCAGMKTFAISFVHEL
ncbi:hypothetical protein PCE1_000476 [Barthelona sp. PCE]